MEYHQKEPQDGTFFCASYLEGTVWRDELLRRQR
jgi:hypothetical protein